MTAPTVVALDLSLTATGWAHNDCYLGGAPWTVGTFTAGKLRGLERLVALRFRVLGLLADGYDRLVIEDSLVRSSSSKVIGELHGAIKLALYDAGYPEPVLVAPASLKLYATGKGNAGKPEMLSSAIQRLGYTGSDPDEVDALWLMAMGLDALGAPLVKLPEVHRRSLVKVAWR